MPDLTETIARAIYEDRNGPGAVPWSRRPDAHKEPYRKDAVAAIRSITAAGYQIVPVEPTFEMIEEFVDLTDDSVSASEAHSLIRERYRAMLKAAKE